LLQVKPVFSIGENKPKLTQVFEHHRLIIGVQ
jgi:hypothetical protein